MKLARLGNGPEIFNTLQGEGVSAGLPATFVRSSLCNLHCQWCDTDYTWNFEGTPWPHDKDADPGYRKHRKEDVILEMDAQELAQRICAWPTRRLVFTGGEPLLQEKGWLELMEALPGAPEDWTVEVETNGTRLPGEAFAARVSQFNVSPKLPNSGMAESLRIVPEALAWFAASPKAWFKFVAIGEEDFARIRELQERFSISPARILLMPEGRSATTLDTHAPAVAEACIRHGWRFCDRLHIRLWGEKRGV